MNEFELCTENLRSPRARWSQLREAALTRTIASCLPDVELSRQRDPNEIESFYREAGNRFSFVESRGRELGMLAAVIEACQGFRQTCVTCPFEELQEDVASLQQEAKARGITEEEFAHIRELAKAQVESREEDGWLP